MKKLRMKRLELGNKKREREGWWTGRVPNPLAFRIHTPENSLISPWFIRVHKLRVTQQLYCLRAIGRADKNQREMPSV
jgi:hypothetical protein